MKAEILRAPRVALVCAVALSFGSLACSASSTSGTLGIPDEGGVLDSAVADALASAPGDDGSGDEPEASTSTFVRLAQLSPDTSAVDVCVAPHGSTAFRGPLIGQLAASMGDVDLDGGDAEAAPGISYSQVSAYMPLDAGAYDVQIVAAGASDCASPLVAATPLPTLAAGAFTTVLLAGEASPAGAEAPLGLTALVDDSVLPGGAAMLRVVNAVPSVPALDFGLGSAAAWIPVFTGVAFGAAGSHAATGEGTLDPAGYLPIGPLSAQPMSARPADADAATDTAVATSVEVDFGSIATLVAIGGKTGDAAHPPQLLLCIDNQPSGGLLSDCSVAR
jgi:hypothetical protein